MLELQKAIKKIIERFIVNITPLASSVSAGDTTIPIKSTRRYELGDEVVIYNKPSMDAQAIGEVHTIECLSAGHIVTLDSPLEESYTEANSFMEKMVGGTFLSAVYLGSPSVIPQYPAITVDAKSKHNEWLTLESTSEEFNIDITVYVTERDYDTQYELMHRYLKAIEDSLFRSFYPLVEPFQTSTLAEAVTQGDTVIKVVDQDLLLCAGAY